MSNGVGNAIYIYYYEYISISLSVINWTIQKKIHRDEETNNRIKHKAL